MQVRENIYFYMDNTGLDSIIQIRGIQHTGVWRRYGQCFLPRVCSVAVVCNCHLKRVDTWSTMAYIEVTCIYSVPLCDVWV